MKNFTSRNSINSSVQSSHLDVEELTECNKKTPENRELFSQVLQIIKILKHHLIIENQIVNDSHTMTIPGSSPPSSSALLNKTEQLSAFNAMDALDSLTAQLSELNILSNESSANITKSINQIDDSDVIEKYDLQQIIPEQEVLTRIQSVMDDIIKHKG